MRSTNQATRQSQEAFMQNAKRNQLVEDIRSLEKDLLKRSKKFVQNIALTAHTGIAVSEIMTSAIQKFKKSDVSNIQRVCGGLQRCGEMVLNFVQVMDQLQLDLDKYLCESIKNLIDEELNVAANVQKIESMKSSTSITNPKLSNVVANSQMAIDKFEIETLGQYINVHQSFLTFNSNMNSIGDLQDDVTIARTHHQQYQKAYEENSKCESTSYRNYFGIPLKKLLAEENRMNSQIPLGLEKAFKYLYSNGLTTEGLFRKSSSVDQINYMKMKFLAMSYSNQDPHLVASLIKVFLKEIPGKLFPKTAVASAHNWYNMIQQPRESNDQVNKLCAQINAEIPLVLPLEHYTCLKYIIAFASALSHNPQSLMTSENIATCLAPTLFYADDSLEGTELLDYNLQCNQVFKFFIDNANTIFPSAKRCFNGRKKSVFLADPSIYLDDNVDSNSASPKLPPPTIQTRHAPQLIEQQTSSKHQLSPNTSRYSLV